ncbi:MAG: hypothetical protein IJ462_02610 [Clostridia bacterium]|nr:hypothetical protein [Clostridia bacterium]
MKKRLFIFYITVFLWFLCVFAEISVIYPQKSERVQLEDFCFEPFTATVQGMTVYGDTYGSKMEFFRYALPNEAGFNKNLIDLARSDGFLSVTDTESNYLYRYIGENPAKYAYKNTDSGIVSLTAIDDGMGGSLCVVIRASSEEDARLFDNITSSIYFIK